MPTHKEVARNYVAQTGKAQRGYAMFYDGPLVFSYGRHFTIAKLFPKLGIALVTTRGYSVSTAKHIGIIRNALIRSPYKVIMVSDPNAFTPEQAVANYRGMLADALDARIKAERARLQVYREMHASRAADICRDAETYRAAFGVTL